MAVKKPVNPVKTVSNGELKTDAEKLRKLHQFNNVFGAKFSEAKKAFTVKALEFQKEELESQNIHGCIEIPVNKGKDTVQLVVAVPTKALDEDQTKLYELLSKELQEALFEKVVVFDKVENPSRLLLHIARIQVEKFEKLVEVAGPEVILSLSYDEDNELPGVTTKTEIHPKNMFLGHWVEALKDFPSATVDTPTIVKMFKAVETTKVLLGSVKK